MQALKEGLGVVGIIAFALTVIVAVLAPYVTHIVWCIQKADETGSAIALLIVGVVAAPVGWIHGVCIWFGFGWI